MIRDITNTSHNNSDRTHTHCLRPDVRYCSWTSALQRASARARICDVRSASVSIICCTRRTFSMYAGILSKVAAAAEIASASRAFWELMRSRSAAWRACSVASSATSASCSEEDAAAMRVNAWSAAVGTNSLTKAPCPSPALYIARDLVDPLVDALKVLVVEHFSLVSARRESE